MSALVGSTPNLTRNGRPRASFSRNSSSLMIFAAPLLNCAMASSACIICNCSGRRLRRQRFPTLRLRTAALQDALFIFIQELAHLFDGQRRILSIQRFLTLALFAEWMLVGKVAAGDSFIGVVRITHTTKI